MRQETRVKTLTGSLKASLRAAHEEGGRARARADGLRAHLEVAGARIRELTLELAARGVELDEATKRGDLGQREVDREERIEELEQELATERAALELLKGEAARVRGILGGACDNDARPLEALAEARMRDIRGDAASAELVRKAKMTAADVRAALQGMPELAEVYGNDVFVPAVKALRRLAGCEVERAALASDAGRIRAILGGSQGDAKGPLPELVLALHTEHDEARRERDECLRDIDAAREWIARALCGSRSGTIVEHARAIIGRLEDAVSERDTIAAQRERFRAALVELRDADGPDHTYESREIARRALAQ